MNLKEIVLGGRPVHLCTVVYIHAKSCQSEFLQDKEPRRRRNQHVGHQKNVCKMEKRGVGKKRKTGWGVQKVEEARIILPVRFYTVGDRHPEGRSLHHPYVPQEIWRGQVSYS